MERLNAVVTSYTFWALVSITSEVSLQCEFLGRWCESCPCHEDRLSRVLCSPSSQNVYKIGCRRVNLHLQAKHMHGCDCPVAVHLAKMASCEDILLCKRFRSRVWRDNASKLHPEISECSRRGCRAPELASGLAIGKLRVLS